MRVQIQTEAFTAEQELAAFARGGEAGAMASFVGYCRGDSSHGAVDRLELEHYPELTRAEITRLADEVRRRHGTIDILVIHRVGAVPAGEAIVLVAALSAHRAAAFAAVSELMDYLKSEAPIWKKEIGANGAVWVEPTAHDYNAAAAWRLQQETETP